MNASHPSISDRRVETIGVSVGSPPRTSRDDLLAGIASPPPPSVKEVVESRISEVGPKAAAEAVRDDFLILPTEKRTRIEEVARQWSLENPREAWSWIEDQLEERESEAAFNQAAISGYIESVALIDPEAAVNAADLLDPVLSGPTEPTGQSSGVFVSADPGFPGDPGFITRNRK